MDLSTLFGNANLFGGGAVIQYAQAPQLFSPGQFTANVPGFQGSGVGSNVDVSAGSGSSPLAGLTFTPPPLVLGGGTTIPSSIGFDLPLAGYNVDQAAQGYAFTANNIANAYNFESNAAQNTLAFDQPFFTDVATALAQIGTSLAQAMQTAANRLPKSSGGGIFGALFG